MDPLTALGVAGNVVAFVQFASSLITGTHNIYRSPSGQSKDAQTLEEIYATLFALSTKLGPSGDGSIGKETAGGPTGLQQLAGVCRQDCERLLGLVVGLKSRGGGGDHSKVWKSFKKALSDVCHAKEIDQLQKRIASCERAMVVHFCAASK